MTTNIAVGQREGRVVLQFQNSVEWIALDPDNAAQIGEAMARAAYEIRYGKVPDDTPSVIKQQKVNVLYQRIENVLRSMARKNKTAKHIAHEVVDLVLAEIT